MDFTYDKLHKELKSGKIRNFYLLQGEEPYFIDHLQKYIEDHALTDAEKGFNQSILYGKDVHVEDVIGLARQYPMMGNRQVVIVKEAQQLKNIDKLEHYAANPPDTTVLVIAYKGKPLRKNSKLLSNMHKSAATFTSNILREYALKKWFVPYLLEEYKLRIKEETLSLMIQFLGNDIQKLINEVKKINIKGNKTEITIDDVKENIGFGRDFDVFEVQDAMASRNKMTLTRIVQYFSTVMKNQHLIGIISILHTYFAQAYVLYFLSRDKKKAECMEAMGLSEWIYGKLLVGINNYGHKLDEVLEILKEYELKSKGINANNSDPAEILKEMLFKIVTL